MANSTKIMSKITLQLDTRKGRKKQDGSFPLSLLLSHNYENTRINLKISIIPEEWDQEKVVVINHPNSKFITAKIKSLFAKAELYLRTNHLETSNMQIKELKEHLKVEMFSDSKTTDTTKQKYLERKLNPQSFLDYANKKIARLRIATNDGNANAIKMGVSRLSTFLKLKDADLLFSAIDSSILKDFIAYCQSRGNKPNTINAYLRPIKTLFNEAIAEKLIPITLYPFSGVKMLKAGRTKKRALKMEVINAIRSVELKYKSAIWHAKNYFLYSFNNRGMNLIDIAKLQKNQIIDEVFQNDTLVSCRVIYNRSKSKGDFSIKQTSESIAILNYYLEGKKDNDFIFPIGFEFGKIGYERYKKKRQRINGRIREIAKIIRCTDDITSYWARHSWATIAKQKGISAEIISDGLGHGDLKTTAIYLADFDDDFLDDVNESIVE